jgi:protocatechuate 3,4-dioxygenase beta subunit
MRPSHTHFYVHAEGYHPLVTQIYDREDPYVKKDSVFAVKDSLIVDFVKTNDPRAEYDLKVRMFGRRETVDRAIF